MSKSASTPHFQSEHPPRPYTPPHLERLGVWSFATGASCEPGVVCFDANPLNRLLRQGPGVGR